MKKPTNLHNKVRNAISTCNEKKYSFLTPYILFVPIDTVQLQKAPNLIIIMDGIDDKGPLFWPSPNPNASHQQQSQLGLVGSWTGKDNAAGG